MSGAAKHKFVYLRTKASFFSAGGGGGGGGGTAPERSGFSIFQ